MLKAKIWQSSGWTLIKKNQIYTKFTEKTICYIIYLSRQGKSIHKNDIEVLLEKKVHC